MADIVATKRALAEVVAKIGAGEIAIITLLGRLITDAITATWRIRFIRIIRIAGSGIQSIIIRVTTGIRTVIARIAIVVDCIATLRNGNKACAERVAMTRLAVLYTFITCFV